MKIKLLAILGLFFLSVACENDKVDSKSTFFRAKIDGKAVEAIGATAYAVKNTTEYNIYGAFENNQVIYLQLENSKGVGTHQITANPNFAFYTDASGTGNRSDRAGSTGEVTISEKTDTNVKGTFKFTAKDSNNSTKVYTVTEGEFSVAFR